MDFIINSLKIGLLSTCCCLMACSSTKISNFQDFQKMPLLEARIMPSAEEFKDIATTIVILNFKPNSNEMAQRSDLANTLTGRLRTILMGNGFFNIVNRDPSAEFNREMLIHEMKGGELRGILADLDYIVEGEITNATFEKKFNAGHSFVDAKSGVAIKTPDTYNYTASVSGNIYIYQPGSTQIMKTIPFKGIEKRTENVQRSGTSIVGMIDIVTSRDTGQEFSPSLVRIAGEKAIENAQKDLYNFFAVRGYILERRNLNSKNVFKINVGTRHGITEGNKVEVYDVVEETNPITGELERNNVLVGLGMITSLVNESDSWILIEDKLVADKIRLGNLVKVYYKPIQYKHTEGGSANPFVRATGAISNAVSTMIVF